ncbi:dinucleotide-utilizing enzyme possibly involved in molybdopterin or thiamin biosynthesis [Beggiatoa alba B18LD]|uniref:Dinucleotide-utilizing enzyme possibly involved in molybdopterin or thiamin biosynthesis n=1 Tax=Beggiatoa alba B18LD TaxID=395493 RepID=I3CJM6_9GAMM|nr:HesA/MoeB/ThiF family protein [Beggiatoa alba]EIJ43819.1 dinucleotide-utilizing enzyme possibly involved in molybdopterin or thiamin biosynthesis [Beggiatoa alba B18LD]
MDLAHANVIIIGLGGLGSPVALYLASSGIGQLQLVDADTVDLTNLQRQIIHETTQIGRYKVESARTRLQQLAPQTHITCHPYAPQTVEQLIPLLQTADIVVDCSDNFPTRFALNTACFRLKKPLISGAAIQWGGQVAVFDPRYPESPCYHCLYEESPLTEDAPTCSTTGIIAPLVGVIGSFQALAVLNLLNHPHITQHGKLHVFNAFNSQWRTLTLSKDPTCCQCQAQ